MIGNLDRYRSLPRRELAKGETLIAEKISGDCIYVVESGAFEVIKGGVTLARIAEGGAFIGEMSAVLGSAPTATVVATERSAVRVIENAAAAVRAQPELTLAIAQLLARRLAGLTAYVVDIKQQYAGTDSHLGVMDRVISQLIVATPRDMELGSERSDVPDY
ncbi:MAG TPA: Crp/Fnr family transcriptional regulator [Nevskiaceae bacterium]|nr:Crp/Fnr family transcriptional regulator [Nevskiaceae bacterium]